MKNKWLKFLLLQGLFFIIAIMLVSTNFLIAKYLSNHLIPCYCLDNMFNYDNEFAIWLAGWWRNLDSSFLEIIFSPITYLVYLICAPLSSEINSHIAGRISIAIFIFLVIIFFNIIFFLCKQAIKFIRAIIKV